MTNKADYVLGIRNYIILDSTWDKEELEIPLASKNDCSGLCIRGYDMCVVGRPLYSNRMESKNNVCSLFVRLL